MTFNTEQLNVININSGRHLVLAPPGCGKTAVLAERVRHALRQGVKSEEMLCLTFTNRAARGMQERLNESLAQDLFVGNVHRFCSHFLFDTGLASEGASIIDTDTSMSIIADYMGDDELVVLADNRRRQQYSQVINLQHLMYQCARHYPSHLMIHREDLQPALLRQLCNAFGLSYTQEATIQLYENIDYYHEAATAQALSREAQTLLHQLYGARCYERYKHDNQLLDFADLLLYTYDQLTAADDDRTQQRYSWLQVDEVQDLSPLQLAIIDLFCTPDATVVYLGDTQQAIFSFMGAKSDTLVQLRKRCGEGYLHNFFKNYRSPAYLLDVYNTYGTRQLGLPADMLPGTDLRPTPPDDALRLLHYHDTKGELQEVARLVERLYNEHPEQSIAVVVAYNSDADDVSRFLRTPHFKISGQDVFTTPAMRLLLAHLSVLHSENNLIAWANLLTGLKVYATNAASRRFIQELTRLGIAPADLLSLPGTSYTAAFARCYEQKDLVIFDTETTGLNVFEDDVAQIAALRVRQGQVVDELNIFLQTDRQLPAMLGDVPNPLIDEYQHQPHLAPADGFRQFIDFARGAAILGHNATFDYQIMDHQMSRCSPQMSMKTLWPRYIDSLKLARLLCPRLKSYKLRDLLTQLDLTGQNSHLANDDILATKSLVDHCYGLAKALTERQQQFLSRHARVAERFRNLYGEMYMAVHEQLYATDNTATGPALTNVLQQFYNALTELRRIEPVEKWQYIVNYLNTTILRPDTEPSLQEQLHNHAQEIATLKEADLCGGDMPDRVFVSTVHKAKGLEFDNVIVYDAVKDKFPAYFAQLNKSDNKQEAAADNADDEEARKFYVAISRARKRLFITLADEHTTAWHRVIRREPSPYLDSIKHFFQNGGQH
ncbi:MAG: UvrD-helicase domain-containing protein [Prevotella sp.]|nr:UvrD-helicase domain-containing protein [Prevotella sp.]